jgi:hypothetical protein
MVTAVRAALVPHDTTVSTTLVDAPSVPQQVGVLMHSCASQKESRALTMHAELKASECNSADNVLHNQAGRFCWLMVRFSWVKRMT